MGVSEGDTRWSRIVFGARTIPLCGIVRTLGSGDESPHDRSVRAPRPTFRDIEPHVAGGLVDADLGGGLIEQRLPRPGQGRRGGFRSFMAYRDGERIVFLHVFAKSELDNVPPDVQAFWRKIADSLLVIDDAKLQSMLKFGEVQEIWYDA